ncbi:MAG: hypothetical protein HY584_02865 [Candidatus Omnitrophica bacterium]|nr:hypothetical protein [Candidatus Omnitrophota bacterium]
MNRITFFWSRIVEIYQQVFSVLRKNPTVLFLFIWIGIFDVLALVVLFSAPTPPFSYVLAPIIRTFWNDRFLHYPDNFLLLPKLFGHAHFVISTVFGVFISGLVIKKIEADAKGEQLSILSAAGKIFRYYFSLVIVWLISYAVFSFALKGIAWILPKNLWIQLGGAFILGVLIQSLVAFLIPAILIVEKGFLRALGEGFRVGIKNIALMSALILVPMLFAFLISFARLYTPLFVQIQPEIVLWVLACGIVISLLADIFVTCSAALLFLKVRERSS